MCILFIKEIGCVLGLGLCKEEESQSGCKNEDNDRNRTGGTRIVSAVPERK